MPTNGFRGGGGGGTVVNNIVLTGEIELELLPMPDIELQGPVEIEVVDEAIEIELSDIVEVDLE